MKMIVDVGSFEGRVLTNLPKAYDCIPHELLLA